MTLSNEYLKAAEPVEVLAIMGHTPSNTWIGNSQVLEPILERVTIREGEELHNLVGGLFYVPTQGKILEVRLTQPRHIFEKNYGPSPEYLAIEALKKSGALVPDPSPTRGLKYRSV